MTIPILIRVIEGIIEGDITTTYAYDANGNRASQAADEVAVMYTYNQRRKPRYEPSQPL